MGNGFIRTSMNRPITVQDLRKRVNLYPTKASLEDAVAKEPGLAVVLNLNEEYVPAGSGTKEDPFQVGVSLKTRPSGTLNGCSRRGMCGRNGSVKAKSWNCVGVKKSDRSICMSKLELLLKNFASGNQ